MKTRILTYIYGLLIAVCMMSCKKFLDVRPDNVNAINPRTVADFEEMLNNSNLAQPNYLVADVASDDISLTDEVLTLGGQASFYVNAYLWNQTVWTAADDDPMYNDTYKSILQSNIIMDNIDQAKDGSTERKDVVRAQARINRAYCYFQLVNLYGNDYQSATAKTDLAVPLVLHPDATLVPARATVQQIYDQVLADLNAAVNTSALPDFGTDVIHPGKAAAYALLARTYLYMGDYEHSLAASESALRMRNTLLDYRSFTAVNPNDLSFGVNNKPFSLFDQSKNPEVILARVCMDADFYRKFRKTIGIDDELRTLLGQDDLRLVYGFSLGISYPLYMINSLVYMQFNYSIGVPEMMLTKAECLARKGVAETALALLNQLRQYRYNVDKYQPLSITPDQDILTLVLEERRRELFLHGGLRLFDLKRLNRENRFKKDLKRFSNTDGHLLSTLMAGSPRYLLPFAPKVIANNPLIIQNQR